MDTLYDVAIIGGGPAGSTAATFLARKGRRVIVLERETFPRFHIGESLLPCSIGALDRLGVREILDARFVPKHGGEMATACGRSALKFYFRDGRDLPHRCAYQVVRSEFDKILLDNARDNGAEVREGCGVESLNFSDDDVTLRIKNGADPETLRARYVIDASGRNTVVGSALGLKRPYEDLHKFSVYAHYDGVEREQGQDGTLLRLVKSADCWFWMIPISDTRTSVGMVLDTAAFKAMKQSPTDALEAAIAAHPVVKHRMRNATRVTPVHATGDYSYRHTALTGPRWMLAGDAAGFIDPIFSTGVFLAIFSGEKSADAIDAALASPRRRARAFKNYEREIRRIMKLYLRFVKAWYRPEFIEVISYPVKRFEMAPAVNAILAGHVGRNFSIWWRMQLFYIVVFLQRYLPLCPRFR